jgi:hypothetical protein
MAKMKTVDLIPHVPIRLAIVTSSDPTPFTTAFNEVWRRLPNYTSEALIARWSMGDALVCLTTNWAGRGYRLAECSGRGEILHFLSPALDRMPDDIVRICVAHELAHAYFYSIGEPYHCAAPLAEDVCRRLAEALAREMSDIWGFPSLKLSIWCTNNIEWVKANAAADRQ